jgi:mannose-6-phosphate isomerase
MQPLVFAPFLRPTVWGGQNLAELFGKPLPDSGRYGESWEISSHPLHVSRVAEGPLQGRLLSELCRDYSRELFGQARAVDQPFPLLVKLLDCQELLSIQVHPTDEQARQLAGEMYGKTEAWVVLQAAPGARIEAGFHPGVTRDEVERRLAEGTLEEALHGFTPRPGDCVFLPAGVVHAVGGGVVLFEVQQSSDATFRLYDWKRVGTDGKPRPLHIPQALASIAWQAGPARPVTPVVLESSSPGLRVEQLVRCPYFQLDRVTLAGSARMCFDQLSIWFVLDGAVRLTTSAGYQRPFQRGETVLIPAATSEVEWHPSVPTTLLRVTASSD